MDKRLNKYLKQEKIRKMFSIVDTVNIGDESPYPKGGLLQSIREYVPCKDDKEVNDIAYIFYGNKTICDIINNL